MRLSCKKLFMGVIAASFACHDPVAAPPPDAYALANINGRPLPTFVLAIPEAPTITSAVLLLERSGRARLTEHRRDMGGTDLTYTSNYTYKINGNNIQFEYNPPCPPNAICVAPPSGTIASSRLLLTMYGPNSEIVYDFVLMAIN
ncbi:MAG: hypothetical protein ACJ78G_13240 [Gemmatimonadaceae bacterium]